ncbi:MAG: sugar phosphate isomerase/epimerase family protein [Planctomycetales bacterium]
MQGRSGGSRISINQMTTYRGTFAEDVEQYQAAGVGGIAVWHRKLWEFGEERGADLVLDSKLAVTSLWCAGGFTGYDGQSFQESLDEALAALRLASELRAENLIVVTGHRAGHTTNHAQELVCDALFELGEAANDLDLQVALHPMTDADSLLTSLPAALKLLRRCGHRRVGLACDLAEWKRAAPLNCSAAALAPWVKVALITTPVGLAVGDGSVPCSDAASEAVQEFEAAGYQGWYELQLQGSVYWSLESNRLLEDCDRGLRRLCPVPAPAVAPVPVESDSSAASQGSAISSAARLLSAREQYP